MDELENWKSNIDLTAFVKAYGFEEDRKENWTGNRVFRGPHDEKIAIGQKDGRWLFYNFHNPDDRGTITDFAMRDGLDTRHACDEIRKWLGEAPKEAFVPAAKETVMRDRRAIEEALGGMRYASEGHPYLSNDRGIPPLALQWWRFAHVVKKDHYGSAIFPHKDKVGWSGWEARNRKFKGFSPGGWKGLWLSKTILADNKLVVTEGGVKALSYALLYPEPTTRYASLGGAPSKDQMEVLAFEINRLPNDAEIVAAGDNDAVGKRMAEFVMAAAELSTLHSYTFRSQYPDPPFKDWGDQWDAVRRQSPVDALRFG